MKQLLLIAIVGIMCTSVANAGVTITSNSVVARVVSQSGGIVVDSTANTNVPFSTLLEADNGDSNSRVQVDYSQSAGQTIFDYSVDQTRNGVNFGTSQGYNGSMYFSVDADTTYNVSGHLNADDVSATTAGRIFFQAFLKDLTLNQVVLQSRQESRTTLDQSFVLGNNDGDHDNVDIGNLSGLLIAGHDYFFDWNAFIATAGSADDGATALGDVILTVGAATDPVPEPASLSMWAMMSGLGLIALRRRRQQEINVS